MHSVIPEGLIEGHDGTGREWGASLTGNNNVIQKTQEAIRKTQKKRPPDRNDNVSNPHPSTKNIKSSPLLEDRCCNCTKHSICTRRCECRATDRPCLSCKCISKCTNLVRRVKVKLKSWMELTSICLSEREIGGVLLPGDKRSMGRATNSGQHMLESEHPIPSTPNANTHPRYESEPEFIAVNVTEDSVEATTHKLSDGVGFGGVDS
jgi:hypothetical protein